MKLTDQQRAELKALAKRCAVFGSWTHSNEEGPKEKAFSAADAGIRALLADLEEAEELAVARHSASERWYQKFKACENELTATRQQLEEWEKLRDPLALHQSILNSRTICLTREQALHIAGATDYDAIRQQLAEAQAYAYEQNAALRCAITQLCDCGRYLSSYDYQHIAEKCTPQDVIDYYLSEATAPYKQALQAISSIENRHNCGDWDEIEEARAIADAVLYSKEKSNDHHKQV